MNAVIFEKSGDWKDVLELRRVNEIPLNDYEVKVKILARPINPSDEMFVQGVYRQKPLLPQIAGLEGCGIVEQTGKGIDRSLVGQQVSFRAKGTWAETITLGVGHYRVVPSSIPPEVACQLTLNTLTAYALLDRSEIKADQWLLITAANSSVGRQLVQLAKLRNIKVVAAIRKDQHAGKLNDLGADLVINSERENLQDVINDTIESGINASVDSVGGSVGSAIIKVAAPFSKVVIYGRLSNEAVNFSNGDLIYKNLRIEGFGIDAWMKSKSQDELDSIWQEILQTVSAGELTVAYDGTYALTDFSSAIKEYVENGTRVILR